MVVLLSLSDIDRLSLMREGKILLMRRDETEMTACCHSSRQQEIESQTGKREKGRDKCPGVIEDIEVA